jgi:mannose-6-phosphate isomerase-like protein (cupin superfamily)
MDDGFAFVDPDDVDTETFHTCDVSHRKLTETLGCTEMRVNQVLLAPGDVTTPHAHEGQEEVFVAMTGGRIEVGGETVDVPEGGVVRVDSEPARSLRNDTDDETHVWLAFGAPPVGTVEDFGSYTIPDE